MGKFGSLTKHLQEVLQSRRVPFVVVGGTGIFERETVLDLLAYLNVCVGSDDDSFERVINKPPR
jgi:superfamily I DNA/RNA helicase